MPKQNKVSSQKVIKPSARRRSKEKIDISSEIETTSSVLENPVVDIEIVPDDSVDGDEDFLSTSAVSDMPIDYDIDPDIGLESPIDSPQIDSKDTYGVVKYDPLQSFINEARRYPILTKDEEHQLAVKFFQTKDQQAAYKLILSNLRLVISMAREYQRSVQNILDLVQEGNIGLMEAVKQYDPFRGVKFATYASYWIRAYMLRYIISNLRLVKIGTTQNQRKLFFNLQKEKARLEAEGFAPESRLLASRLNVKESEVLEMEQRLALPDISVDAPLGNNNSDDHVMSLSSILADESQDVERFFANKDFSEKLIEIINQFKLDCSDKEVSIIEKRLFTEEPITLQEIANEFGVSKERIRQIESRLKERLKLFVQDKLSLGEEGEIKIV